MQIINKGITASAVVMNALRTLFWLSALYNFHIAAVYLAGTDNALADSISRVHETTGLHNFYAFLCSKFSTVSASSVPLAAHMSVYSVNYLFCQVHGILPSSTAHRGSSVLSFPAFRHVYQSNPQNPPQHLLSLLQSYGLHTYSCASTTSSSICRLFGSIAKPQSIRGYPNIISILHKEFGFPNPLIDNWPLKSLLTGIKRAAGAPPNQTLLFTEAILLCLHSTLNFTLSFDASFWVICLVAFFGMFRKAHLLPISSGKFDSSKQLTKADFRVFHWGTLITIRWSKTIQFRERVVEIPLPCIPRSRLCPTAAIIHAFSFTPSTPDPRQPSLQLGPNRFIRPTEF